jgi:hypothetical protein
VKELREDAKRVKGIRPAWARIYIALAQLDEIEGLNDSALTNYMEAIDKGDRQEFVIRRMVELYRRRFEHYGHGQADQAIVGLGGHVFMRKNSQDAIREFRPYFDHAPVYGGGPSLEEYMEQTPMTIGSPQEVIDRTMSFRDVVGDYQRQLFLADHAGLPLKTVLEQMDMLGELVVPVLRKEFEALRPAHVPDGPTHAGRKAAAAAENADTAA